MSEKEQEFLVLLYMCGLIDSEPPKTLEELIPLLECRAVQSETK